MSRRRDGRPEPEPHGLHDPPALSPPTPGARVRADRLLVLQGLVASREQARRAIEEGRVYYEGRPLDRPAERLVPGASLEVRGEAAYVSRGGLKLQHALDRFKLDVQGMVAMDVGASTGGFTDCLLQRGARRVYAVDVGYGQLAWKLRQDPRVVVLERTNIRYLEPQRIGEAVDLITVDVAFISVTRFLHRLPLFLREGGHLLVLVKPQFEAGPRQVGRGGVVRDDQVRAQVLRSVVGCAVECGFALWGMTASPLLGPSGNAEFFAYFRWPRRQPGQEQELEQLVAQVLQEAPDRAGASAGQGEVGRHAAHPPGGSRGPS